VAVVGSDVAAARVVAFDARTHGRSRVSRASALVSHQTLLSRGIPVYEQLQHVDRLLGRKRLYFVGAPLDIKDGDGMMVRPVVFVY